MDSRDQDHAGHQYSDHELEPRPADYHALSQEETLQDDADAVSSLEEPLEAVTQAISEQQGQEFLQTGTHAAHQQQEVLRDDADGVSQQQEPLRNSMQHQKLHKDDMHAVKSSKSSIASLDDWLQPHSPPKLHYACCQRIPKCLMAGCRNARSILVYKLYKIR